MNRFSERASTPVDQRVVSLHDVDSGDGHHHGLIVAAWIERPISGGVIVWREDEHRPQYAAPMPPTAAGRARKHRQERVEDLIPRHRSTDEDQIAERDRERGHPSHGNQANFISFGHVACRPGSLRGVHYSNVISQRLAVASHSAPTTSDPSAVEVCRG